MAATRRDELPPLRPEDIRRQVVLEEHDASPDGRWAVVVRRVVRENGYESHLWRLPLVGRGPARRLTSGPVRDGWPRVSPDGRRIAFRRGPSAGEDGPTRALIVPSAGGDTVSVSPDALVVGEIAWSPDGRMLAFTAPAGPPRHIVGPVTGPRPAPTARRITRLDWRYDGEGYLDRWEHLFIAPARRGARPRRLTDGAFSVANIAWHPSGDRIAYAADPRPAADLLPRTSIWTVRTARRGPDRAPREILALGGRAWRPAFSPDGRWVVAIGIADGDALDDASPGLFVGPADGSAAPWPLAPDLDRPIGDWTDTDLHGWTASARPGPAWASPDTIVATVTDRGRSRPWAFPVDPGSGRARAAPCGLASGELTTHSLAVAPAPASGAPGISAVGTLDASAMEVLTFVGGRPRRRTTIGSAWQRRRRPTVVTARLVDGRGGPIETWVAAPPGTEGRLPTVVDIHGGPLGAWVAAPSFEVQLLVARGYRVLLPNIRGSASFGRHWIRPQLGDWGGVDADDVHAVVDDAIAGGLADPDRIGLLGLSYGGFLVQWLIGTSARFGAAVAENGVANQVSAWANSDIGPGYSRTALLGDTLSPEGVAKLWRQSPLRNVAAIRTPLLILQGEADLRCAAADNEQLFVALRALGRTVEYVVYPEEGHLLQAVGRPDRRIDRMTRMLEWFDRHLRARETTR